MFRALIAEKNNQDVHVHVTQLDEQSLPDGDVVIDVEYSTINYKDGLAVTNKAPVVRSWPMIPGIDLAGRVADSNRDDIPVGLPVVINGWGLGETHWGGFSQRARVNGDWTVPVPEAFDTKQAMAIGTAGFTAMLCLIALKKNNVLPDSGPVVVTGASGGVGSIAVSLLSEAGYQVHASTGRPEENAYLTGLGASNVIHRKELAEASNRKLAQIRWAGAIDCVGSHTLANVLASVAPEGCVVSCGNTQGMDLPTSVAPFILRGVTLRGIHSVTVPRPLRMEVWDQLAANLNVEHLASMTQTVNLAETLDTCRAILSGQVRGRVVLDVNQ